MATNKQLVEQAVAAIPKWQEFLNQKEAEQNAILAEMQDDEVQFAPKSLTQRLTDKFRSKPKQPEQSEQPEQPEQIKSQEDDLDISDDVNRVKLEKEGSQIEEPLIEDEYKSPVSSDEDEHEPPISSDNDDKQPVDKKDFKDLF